MPKQLALANRQLFPESSILCTQERVSTMQWMLRGGVWRGEDGQVHSLGGKLRSLKDARPGREHLPFPFIDQLTSFWQIHTKETEEQSLGNGPWEVAQRTWHQWSSGRRSGKLDTSVPSAPELKVLGEALSRDFKDLKVDLEACSFEHPTGFISGFGGRQRRLRTGDHVSIGYDTGELGYMRIAKAVTVVLDDKRRIHSFPYWYRADWPGCGHRPATSQARGLQPIAVQHSGAAGVGARASPCRAQVPANVCEARRCRPRPQQLCPPLRAAEVVPGP